MPLDDLFPAEVAVSTLDEGSVPPPLFPGELEAVARAVVGRRDEFARGRACARAAIARLGLPAYPILVNENRAPIWPDGVVGSITHCRGLVAAAACRKGRILGLGLDAEPLEPVETEVARLVWSAEECRRAAETMDLEERLAAKLIFSAKETVHKCIEPLTGEALDFLDVEIVLDPDARAFAVRPVSTRSSAFPQLGWIAGRFRISRTHILTAGVVQRGLDVAPGVHST
jgi:4'-phosphopantetheinyl transferase EntD